MQVIWLQYILLKSKKKKPPIAMMYALINVSWRLCTRTNVSKTEGVHSFCCGFLSKKIKIWQKIIFNAENNWLWTNRTILSHMAVHIRHGRLAGYLTAIHHPEIMSERGSREIFLPPQLPTTVGILSNYQLTTHNVHASMPTINICPGHK